MPILEIRRHAYTKKGDGRGRGSHLSQAGVELARRIGTASQQFDFVYTSTVPRTRETAIAMGFAVDEEIDALGLIPDDLATEMGHHDRWSWEHPFVTFRSLVEQGGPIARLGETQRRTWVNILEDLPEDGEALAISHGRVIESGLVNCFPNAPFNDWGPAFTHCEGARLTYSGDFKEVQLLRVKLPAP